MRFAKLLLAVGLALGCKGRVEKAAAPPNPMGTPRGTAEVLVKAFGERNGDLAVTLLPPNDLLKASFDCPAKRAGRDHRSAA